MTVAGGVRQDVVQADAGGPRCAGTRRSLRGSPDAGARLQPQQGQQASNHCPSITHRQHLWGALLPPAARRLAGGHAALLLHLLPCRRCCHRRALGPRFFCPHFQRAQRLHISIQSLPPHHVAPVRGCGRGEGRGGARCGRLPRCSRALLAPACLCGRLGSAGGVRGCAGCHATAGAGLKQAPRTHPHLSAARACPSGRAPFVSRPPETPPAKNDSKKEGDSTARAACKLHLQSR